MVIKNAFRKKILWQVCGARNHGYLEGVAWLKRNGFTIYVVTDGMWGLAQALWPYPVQLCQFHQILIVRRYPKFELLRL